MEICEAVIEPCTNSDKVKFKTIEHVEKAGCIIHRGDYEIIGKSYSILFAWAEDNGYEIIGKPRKSYIDGIWNKDNPEE